jgi:hypothetical protein
MVALDAFGIARFRTELVALQDEIEFLETLAQASKLHAQAIAHLRTDLAMIDALLAGLEMPSYSIH